MSKPIGIKLIIAINILYGILSLLGIYLIIYPDFTKSYSTYYNLFMGFLFIGANFVSAYGLYTIKQWSLLFTKISWIIALIVYLVTILLEYNDVPKDKTGNFILELSFNIVFTAIVIKYLSKQKIKSLYGNC